MHCIHDSTDLLIEIINKLNGTSYLCGNGAGGYQEDSKFEKADIKLQYQNFQHPVYNQFNTEGFIPGLSIIDPLMNIGYDGVKELLYINDNKRNRKTV